MALTKEQLLALIQKAQATKAAKAAATAFVNKNAPVLTEIPTHMQAEHVVDAISTVTERPALKPSWQVAVPSTEVSALPDLAAAATDYQLEVAPDTIETPATTAVFAYTDEQQAAIDAAGKGWSFVMCGFAGTGKTTAAKGCAIALIASGKIRSISRVTKYLQAGFPGVAVVSYTNKAVQNIKRQMPESFKPHTITLHKLIQFEPVFYEIEDPQTGQIRKTMRFEPKYNANNPLPRELGVVIIEESSMVGIDLYAMYRAACPHKPQEIFLGDLNQLPPVFGSAVLGFKMLSLPVIALTKPQRQASESSILRFSWDIKDGKSELFRAADNRTVEVDHPSKPGATISKRVWNWASRLQSENTEAGRITVRPFQKKLLESHAMLTVVTLLKQWSVPETCADPLLKYNPDEDIILTPFNKAFGTIEMNRQISQFLGERRNAVVYEVIAGYNKHYLAVGDRIFYNKEECHIINIARNGEYMGKIPQAPSINLDRWGNFKEVGKEEGYHESAESEDDDLELLAGLTMDNIEDRVNAASHVLTLRFTDGTELEIDSAAEFNAMLGGYALTVHKSQGSEWQKVFIFLHHTQATMHSRELLYTAVTRARTDLVILCEPDSIEKCINQPRLAGVTMEEKIEKFKGKVNEFDQKLIEQGVLL
jgi:hypothetical protein